MPGHGKGLEIPSVPELLGLIFWDAGGESPLTLLSYKIFYKVSLCLILLHLPHKSLADVVSMHRMKSGTTQPPSDYPRLRLSCCWLRNKCKDPLLKENEKSLSCKIMEWNWHDQDEVVAFGRDCNQIGFSSSSKVHPLSSPVLLKGLC